jgi:hypothetical protein
MGMEIGVWRIDSGVQQVELGDIPTEEQLEALLEKDPAILGDRLMIIGRQVQTDRGKRIDLLGIDDEGTLRVLELKRGRAPREAVAQVLEYGAWVRKLSHQDVIELFDSNSPEKSFEETFESTFGFAPPDEINAGHKLTLVSTQIDRDAQAIVQYLDEAFEVPINVIFFRYFKEGDREYIARNYLIDESQEPAGSGRKSSNKKEIWNERDWYVAFDRPWADAVTHGFISAGGGEWYSNTLRRVPEGARIWVYIPKKGYVGYGVVTGSPRAFEDSHLATNEALDHLRYRHTNGAEEWVLPVKWGRVVAEEEAVWQKGMFANQNSACKLRNRYTLDVLYGAFALDVED